MAKVLSIFRNSPAACSFFIALGVGVMLSVAYLDPADASAIRVRHTVGAICLLLPGLAARRSHDG